MSDILWATYEPNGRITITGTAGSRRVAEMQGTLGVDLIVHEIPTIGTATHWVNGAEGVQERPDVPEPASGAVDLIVPLDPYPAGTEIDIDLNTGRLTFSDPADPPIIEVPGAYPYHVRPPFPHQERKGVLEVTDA